MPWISAEVSHCGESTSAKDRDEKGDKTGADSRLKFIGVNREYIKSQAIP